MFLSDDWVLAIDEALDAVTAAGFEPPITIEYHVGGGPEGDRTHQITLGPTGVGARRPSGSGGQAPTVTLSLDWELALAINQGEVSAQEAFLDGRIRLGGDPSSLLIHQEQLTAIDDVVASVRVRTTG
jgi:hypothetical protein